MPIITRHGIKIVKYSVGHSGPPELAQTYGPPKHDDRRQNFSFVKWCQAYYAREKWRRRNELVYVKESLVYFETI